MTAAGLGGAVAIVLVWLIEIVTGVDVPAPVASAIATILAFVAGYLRTEHHPAG